MERVKQLQEALVVARQERAVAHAKFREASAKAKRLADELLKAETEEARIKAVALFQERATRVVGLRERLSVR